MMAASAEERLEQNVDRLESARNRMAATHDHDLSDDEVDRLTDRIAERHTARIGEAWEAADAAYKAESAARQAKFTAVMRLQTEFRRAGREFKSEWLRQFGMGENNG